jgi:hypothetical protein
MGVRGRPWSKEEEAFLDRYASGGMSAREVADQIGRTPTAVAARAHKLGKTKRKWNRNLPEKLVDQVRALHREGATQANIEKKLGVSYHQVRWCLSEESGDPITTKLGRVAPGIRKRIVEGFTEGLVPLSELVQREGMSAHLLRGVLQEEGVDTLFWKKRKQSRSMKGRAFEPRPRKGPVLRGDRATEAVERFVQGEGSAGIAKSLGCRQPRVRRTLENAGFDVRAIGYKRAAETRLRSGWRPPASSGRGKRTPYDTPFQGRVSMRSRTEGVRASELDHEGVAWFYELKRYTLGDTSYLPDFWITKVPLQEAREILGDNPSRKDMVAFLKNHPYTLEDVKGWFNHKCPSFSKIARFRDTYPGELFRVLVFDHRRGTKRWA